MAKFRNDTMLDQAFRLVSNKFSSKLLIVKPGEVVEIDDLVDAGCLRKIPAFSEVK
jgi:hypothetical protein